MKITISKATKEDLSSMMKLIRELAIYEKAEQEVTVSMKEFEDAGFGENPVWGAFLAKHQGETIGMALYYIRYSTWKGRTLYLEDLVVSQAHRRQGIGKQLFAKLIAFGKAQNYSGMMWQVLDWNQSAIDFYKQYPTEFDEEWLNCKLNFKN